MADYLVKRVGTDDIIARINDPSFLAMVVAYSKDELEVTYNRKPIFTHSSTMAIMDRKWDSAIQIDCGEVIPYMTRVIANWDKRDLADIRDHACIRRLAEWFDNKAQAGYYQNW
mgnify:CR=1 FL=1